MARVTVEDCVLKVPNRFDLVMLAGQRARDIASGAPETVDRDNDKNPVVALREIADETIGLEELREKIVVGLQKQQPHDDLEEDEEALGVMEQESMLVSATPGAPVAGLPGVSMEVAGGETTDDVADIEGSDDVAAEAADGDADIEDTGEVAAEAADDDDLGMADEEAEAGEPEIEQSP